MIYSGLMDIRKGDLVQISTPHLNGVLGLVEEITETYLKLEAYTDTETIKKFGPCLYSNVYIPMEEIKFIFTNLMKNKNE